MSQIGTLSEVKIGDVLRLFAAGRKTGLLTVVAGAQRALLRFDRGALVHATNGAGQNGDDVVLDLFGWKDGQISFFPEETPVLPNVVRSLDALVLEGLRAGEAKHKLRELFGNERVVFQMGPGPSDPEARYVMSPLAWRVARLLDGVRDVREVIDAARLPRPDVHRILLELADAGWIEKFEPQKSLRVHAHGLKGTNAELDEKLEREWTRLLRFHAGVRRIEIRTVTGRNTRIDVLFRAGLIRDIALPKLVLGELLLHGGEEVTVRPVG